MKLNKRFITEVELKNKVVFLRLDLNIPIFNSKVDSFKRLDAAEKTIKYLVDKEAKIVILSHVGRPKEDADLLDPNLSMKLVTEEIRNRFNKTSNVEFINKSVGKEVEESISKLKQKDILVLENTRFHDVLNNEYVGKESNNNEELAKYWAELSEVFINDAYGALHRDHASTNGIAKFQPNNAIGFLIKEEVENVSKVITDKKPFVVLFGGAKVSDKLKCVNSLIKHADKVIVSGGLAYTFLAAQGISMGKSRVEEHLFETSLDLLKKYKEKIVLSLDFECAPEFDNLDPTYKLAKDGIDGFYALDVGVLSIEEFKKHIQTANTIFWNGPFGVTEFDKYRVSTIEISKEIAKRSKEGAYTVIGGGDSASAIEKLNLSDAFSWISTGGGASLEVLSETELKGIQYIKKSC